jgi:hypothetical protein
MYISPNKLKTLSIPAGIAREEGWLLTTYARCKENLNPGDLDFEPWMAAFGGKLETVKVGEKARFAVFPTAAQGFAALRHLCGFTLYKGATLAQLVADWAPPVENNTSAYLANVCAWTGLTAATIIDAHLGDASTDPAPGVKA